jgi:molybdate transport system substrate-binding protein
MRGLVLLFFLWGSGDVTAANARIAVASNFRDTALIVARYLEANSPHRYDIIAGSTGKLASQIMNGAPFDVLMAADLDRPQQLMARGFAVPESYFIYAVGELGLWWPDASVPVTVSALRDLDPRSVCIANPAFAPYGQAAWRVLNNADLETEWLNNIVRVDNINLVTGLVAQGQAKAGFVARSAVIAGTRKGSVAADSGDLLWLSEDFAIEQALVVMERARDNTAVEYWIEQMQTSAIRELIRRDGYDQIVGQSQ